MVLKTAAKMVEWMAGEKVGRTVVKRVAKTVER